MGAQIKCFFCKQPCDFPLVYGTKLFCPHCHSSYLAVRSTQIADVYRIALKKYGADAEFDIRAARNPLIPSSSQESGVSVLISVDDVPPEDIKENWRLSWKDSSFPFEEGDMPYREIDVRQFLIDGRPPVVETGHVDAGERVDINDVLLFFCRKKVHELFCPQCWRPIPLPPFDRYNEVFFCNHCSTPYLIHDPTGPKGDFDPLDILSITFFVDDKNEIELFAIPGYDLSENAKDMGFDNLAIGTARWGQWCTFYAARKKKQG